MECNLDYRKTFLVINFLRLMHTEIILKEFILSHHKERRSVPQATRSVTLFARDDKQNRGTIPMPTLAARAVDYEVYNTGEIASEFYGWTADFGTAIRQIP